MSNTNDQIKVGDTLAFECGYGNRLALHKVSRITPSGRIICGQWTLNPDLSIRGDVGYGGPYRAQRLTQKLAERYNKQVAIATIKAVNLNDIDTATLSRVAGLLTDECNVVKSE